MKTSRPVKRKKTAIETIRWKKVLLIPIIVGLIAGGSIGAFYMYNQSSLTALQKRIAQQEAELAKYLLDNQDKLIVNAVLKQAEELAQQYDYEEAVTVLKSNPEIQDNTSILAKITEYQNQLQTLVPYNGDVPVFFMHNLINDPTIAFSKKSHDIAGYRSRYLTTYEFKSILSQLYEKGYVLVDVDDLYNIDQTTKSRKEIKLPEGKKPFILSVDENAYNDYLPVDGFARGMAVRNGEIVTRILTSSSVEFTSDGDVVPIVEGFLKEHPDFSYHGARGILSLTGFAGTLGYRLSSQIEIEDAKALVALLKEKGWTFACTSYSDMDSIYVKNPSASTIASDLKKWSDKIKAIVADTPIFVSPYGNILSGSNLQAIINAGYDVYFYDGGLPRSNVNNGVLFISRIALTGDSLKANKAYLEANFFDVDAVWDPNR